MNPYNKVTTCSNMLRNFGAKSSPEIKVVNIFAAKWYNLTWTCPRHALMFQLQHDFGENITCVINRKRSFSDTSQSSSKYITTKMKFLEFSIDEETDFFLNFQGHEGRKLTLVRYLYFFVLVAHKKRSILHVVIHIDKIWFHKVKNKVFNIFHVYKEWSR